MSTVRLALVAAATILLACSSSSGGGGGGGGSSGGGSGSGSGGSDACSGHPQSGTAGACIISVTNNDAGVPVPDTCIDFTGSGFTAADVQGACAGDSGPTKPMSSCPTTNLIGSCIVACGMPAENVTYYYSDGLLSASTLQMQCTQQNGYWAQ
jgi:hypothetical protein